MKSKYMAIKDCDILSANGLSVSVWFSGCPFRCDGCHNKNTWNFEIGEEFNKDTIAKIINLLNKKHIKALSILGGEPLQERNFYMLEILFKETKKINKEIWLWTGYKWEDIQDLKYLLKHIDVLID